MDTGRTVIFLHGVGGPEKTERWLVPLNSRLLALGYPAIAGPGDLIVEATYLAELEAGVEGAKPPVTWKRPNDETYAEQRAAHSLRQEHLAQVVADLSQRPGGIDLGWVPNGLLPNAAADLIDAVRLYRTSEDHRYASWRAVLEQLPQSGRAVLIAHSFGSVVMADVLDRLPPGLTLDLCVTIGSPLPIEGLRRHNQSFARAFPYSQVKAWVNVFDRRDDVTIGRGIARYYPAVLDVPVDTATSHNVSGYCSHPSVAAVIGDTLFGIPRREVTKDTPARRIGGGWDLQLLSFAFTNQLSATFPTSDWRPKLRLDTARRESARRLTHEIHDATVSVDPATSPDANELLIHAADLVKDNWSDAALLPFAVSLYMSPPVPPFDLHIGSEHREEALCAVLNRVRVRSGDLTDQRFATDVAAAVRQARRTLEEPQDFPWGKALMGVGLGVLAATGVGLVAAVPAGLAGAAAISATLAAFGPGGMVGGMVTIAALSGAGGALASAGLSQDLVSKRQERDVFLHHAAQALAEASVPELRTTLGGLLAVVGAQLRLEMESSAPQVEQLLLELRAILDRELAMHETVAPDRPGTSEWEDKRDLTQRALDWLTRTFSRPALASRESESAIACAGVVAAIGS